MGCHERGFSLEMPGASREVREWLNACELIIAEEVNRIREDLIVFGAAVIGEIPNAKPTNTA